jgi:hypothetical protein
MSVSVSATRRNRRALKLPQIDDRNFAVATVSTVWRPGDPD